MIDLHTHTVLSDGVLIPTELARRAEVAGYRVLGIADHVDSVLVETLVPQVAKVAADLRPVMRMKVVPGAEITHCRLEHIAGLVKRARELGAKVVIVHGETPVEPVLAGTNRAAIEAGCDILAHPGLISQADAALAARRGVLLEVSGRAGHSLANGHVVQIARQTGAQVIFGSDSHSPEDLPTRQQAENVLACAGLTPAEIAAAFAAAEALAMR